MKAKQMGVVVMIAAISFVIILPSLSFAQEIKVAAGAAPAEWLARMKGPFESASGFKLNVVTKGAVQLVQDLDKGAVEASIAGLSFQDWMDVVTKEGYKIADKDAYKYRVIGKDLIKVIVHKDNPVKKLSKEQLKAVFSGKSVNWKDVGGKDLEITLFRSSSMPGLQTIFQKQLMQGEPYSDKFKEVVTLDDIKKQVSQTPGAAGLVVPGLIDNSVYAPEIPEVGRPITLITKGAPSANMLKLLDFIRGESQKNLSK